MASKLYRAIDGETGLDTLYMINDRGCKVSSWFDTWSVDKNITACKGIENLPGYGDMSWFDDAIDPVLIAEW